VTITINAVNDGPVANDDVFPVNEDGMLSGNVVLNDTDVDGPNTLITLVTDAMNGMLTLNGDGTFSYAPDANYNGPDSFTYSYCDGGTPNLCDTATVTINVNAANDGPVANDDVFPVNEDGMLSGNVVLNDMDVDGPDTLITLVTDVLNGMLTLNGDGTFSYTPDANYNGPDSFTYSYCDGGMPNTCDTATVAINISSVNDGPLANDDAFPVDEGGMLSGSVAPNDVDVDGPDTLITLVTDAMNGTLTLNGDGTFSYTPDANYNGPDSFTYSYCDGGTPNTCDTATVNITVNAVALRLNVRVFIQGALLQDTSSLLMFDNLRQLGRIPLTEPYSALSAFTHIGGGGGETIADSSAVLADLGGNSIVDWVFVELRSALDSADVVATRSALLQRDGDVVDVDGSSPLAFMGSSPASYFVSVRHRNHLGVMTEQSIALSGSPVLVDFTSFSTAVYNRPFTSMLNNFNGLEQARINGRYALWAGNARRDGGLIFAGQDNDVNDVFNEVITAPGNVFGAQAFIRPGYLSGDINLVGSTIYAGQNKDVDFIFNNVDSFVKNTFRSQVYIIREQLPNTNLP
jgi:VCBS repeat-containing protein